jgi:hypothetical protein
MSFSRSILCSLLVASTLAHAQRAPLQSSAPEAAPSRDEALWVPKPPEPSKQEKRAPSTMSAEIASGSALGPWALIGAGAFVGGGTFVEPELYGFAGLFTNVAAGFGFDVGPVHLRPLVDVALNAAVALPEDDRRSRFWASPVSLSLAATNLLDEKTTGLRLTPAVGLTIPTSLGRSVPITLLSGAIQLERHFGPIEVALRSEVGKPLYAEYPAICTICEYVAQPRFNWFWINTAQAEGWFNESLSLGLSYAWNIAFGFPVPSSQVAMAPRDPNGNYLSPTYVSTTDTVTGRVFFSWAVSRHFGVSLDLTTTQPPFLVDATGTRRVRFPFLSFGTWAQNDTVVSLGAWFRTDVAISRNWIER